MTIALLVNSPSKVLLSLILVVLCTTTADKLTATQPLGGWPRKDNLLEDILACSGTNAVVWNAARAGKILDDGVVLDRQILEQAKRKTEWYGEIAIWIFEVEHDVLTKALEDAETDATLNFNEVYRIARECRPAPIWREK